MNHSGITRRRALAGIGGLAMTASLVRRGATAGESDSADVLVLGAGIAGLHAAMALQARGLRVTVLESSPRVGGRCWTAQNLPGSPEFGASQIATAYHHVVGHCETLGLELVPPGAFLPDHVKIPGAAISLGGEAAQLWSSSDQNRLNPGERDLLPMQLISHYCAGQNPLQSLSDWLNPAHAQLDALPLRTFLAQQGASGEALRLADAFSPAHSLDDISTLDVMRKEYAYRWYAQQGPYYHVAAGTGALTDAMAASLENPVLTSKRVDVIRSESNGVSVGCSDGSWYQAKAAVCTLPTSTLSRVRIEPEPPQMQRKAWNELAYAKATIVFLLAHKPFWETDGLPPATWSDLSPEYAVLVDVLPTGEGLIMCHINGNRCDQYRDMPPEQVGQDVLRAYVQARPAAAGLVSVAGVHDWNTYPHSLGHIAYFRPGQVGRFHSQLSAPHGTLHFAGEHCGREALGVEAACESAQRAVEDVLETVG